MSTNPGIREVLRLGLLMTLVLLSAGEKEGMAKRVAELEKSLAEAQGCELARGELEKTQVEHLLTLADSIGSKYLGSLPTLPLSAAGALWVWVSFWSRNLRRCSSRRDLQ